jgi:hypothetical protein
MMFRKKRGEVKKWRLFLTISSLEVKTPQVKIASLFCEQEVMR